MSNTNQLKEKFFTAAKFFFAIGLIVFLFKNDLLDFEVLKLLLDPVVLVLGLGLIGISLFLQSLRWLLLLKSRHLSVSFWQTWRLFLIGNFFNYALPGSVGGDVMRGYYIVQAHPARKADAVISVVFDRILGLYSMVFIAVVATLFGWDRIQASPQLTALSTAVLGLFVFMTLFLTFSSSRKLSTVFRIDRLLAKFSFSQSTSGSKLLFVLALGLSISAQVLSILFIVLIGHTIGDDNLPMNTYFFAVPIGFIIAAVPIAPAGLGVGQVAFLYLFQTYSGQQTLVGQTAITAFQLALLMWGILGAIFYIEHKAIKFKPDPKDLVRPA